MKTSSDNIRELDALIDQHGIKSVSFDIDGTVYAMKEVRSAWWREFFRTPFEAMRFYRIKQRWEKRRRQEKNVEVVASDVEFFEEFLGRLLDPAFVPADIRVWMKSLEKKGIRILFLTDHGAKMKLASLGFTGESINCLLETGELKPHAKISQLLTEHYNIEPALHLHLGDRWTDEEQARMLGCRFSLFVP